MSHAFALVAPSVSHTVTDPFTCTTPNMYVKLQKSLSGLVQAKMHVTGSTGESSTMRCQLSHHQALSNLHLLSLWGMSYLTDDEQVLPLYHALVDLALDPGSNLTLIVVQVRTVKVPISHIYCHFHCLRHIPWSRLQNE